MDNTVNLQVIGKSPEELQSALVELRNEFDSHIHDGTNSRAFQTVTADTISAGVLAIKKNNFSSDVSGIWMGLVGNTMKLYLGTGTDNLKWDGSTLSMNLSTGGGITITQAIGSLQLNAISIGFYVSTTQNAGIRLISGSSPFSTGTMRLNVGGVTSSSVDIDFDWVLNNHGTFSPASGDTIDLGTAALRWSVIYLQSSPDVSSDLRFKTNILPVRDGLASIMKMRAVEYRRKGSIEPHFGFIAQEMRKILPQVIGGSEAEGYSVRYEEIIPILVKAVQEIAVKLM